MKKKISKKNFISYYTVENQKPDKAGLINLTNKMIIGI
jgi:hypothetical protein